MRRWAGVLVMVVIALGAASCSGVGVGGGMGTGAGGCFPGRLTTQPTAHPGDTIRVVSESVDCAIDFTDDGRFRLDLGTVGGEGKAWASTTVPVPSDGQFTAELTVPADMPLGEAYVRVASGYQFECNDTGSCADVSVSFIVEKR